MRMCVSSKYPSHVHTRTIKYYNNIMETKQIKSWKSILDRNNVYVVVPIKRVIIVNVKQYFMLLHGIVSLIYCIYSLQ